MKRELFSGSPTYAFEQHLLEKLRKTIATAQLASSIEDEKSLERAIETFVSAFHLAGPSISIPEEGLEPSHTRERTVQNDGRLSRLGMPYTEQLTDIAFIIPFEGDSQLLQLTPNTAPFGSGIVGKLELSENQITYTYTADLNTPREQLQQSIKNDFAALRRHIDAIAVWVAQWNSQLETKSRPLVVQRITELQRQASLTNGLKISF